VIKQEIIERIEGEARIDFELDATGRVLFPTIRFLHFRGMEAILKGRPALDALVITPRVCGICGHSHLMAATRALEAAYAAAGLPVTLSPKAEAIRELTLYFELIQNHLKWFYLAILPELAGVTGTPLPSYEKILRPVSRLNRAIALFAGQSPHASYALPGGVTCDPTALEIVQALQIVDETIIFFETELAGMALETYLGIECVDALKPANGDITLLLRTLHDHGLTKCGTGNDRFFVGGAHTLFTPGKAHHTHVAGIDTGRIGEDDAMTFAKGGFTHAKNALYKESFYETGPLARAMVSGTPLIKNLHRRYKDSILTRITARIGETALLLREVREILQNLDLAQPSFIPPAPIEKLNAAGTGIVEAPRGPLLHTVRLEKGVIADYRIITPTQWNLGHGSRETPGTVQQAMIGAENTHLAHLIFRTFDVCSVCTTH
jgi:Ni,Fe-hydrogenase I large subunit